MNEELTMPELTLTPNAAAAAAPEAPSLTLEPTGRESQMKTLWKEEDSTELHDIMIFTW
jgi:hypothetical protein